MPFKDTSPFLEECITSILNQTYSNWELIAVDDHSEDHSREILAYYEKSDPRIKVYTNQGNGIIPALRLAFENCSGTYITRMDSDDIMQRNKLEVLSNHLNNKGMGHVAVGQVQYFSADGISDGYARYERWINNLTSTGTNYSEIYKECVIPSPCWMIHREDLEKAGAFTPDRYPEDYDLTFRFYSCDFHCIPCKEVLHFWRDYANRTSRTSEHYAQNYFLDIKLHYFLKLDYDSSRPLVIWGAGSKGKTIAKKLNLSGYDYIWLCDNPKKIGKKIYDRELVPFGKLETLQQPQSIITVANEDAQAEIKSYMQALNMHPMSDYFFFC